MPWNWGGAGQGAASGAAMGTSIMPGWGTAIGGVAGGLMGGFTGANGGDPYKDAMKQYREWSDKAQASQQPFWEAGSNAINPYQNWLKGMSDPSAFMNNMMGDYQESPYAHFQQDQALRASGSQGSASGLMGSTPMSQFNQQNARDISSQDMNQWLQHALGINSLYGQGYGNLINAGANSANALTGMYGDFGRSMGDAAYGKKRGQNIDQANMMNGMFDLGKQFFGS